MFSHFAVQPSVEISWHMYPINLKKISVSDFDLDCFEKTRNEMCAACMSLLEQLMSTQEILLIIHQIR